MAFDINDPADLLALKEEVANDPLNIGYDGPDINTAALLDLLNLSANNPVLATGNSPMTAKALLDVIFEIAISSQDQFKIQLLYEGSSGFNDDLSLFRSRVMTLSGAISDAIETITRSLSRAEVLFAIDDQNEIKEFVIISRNDWITARDS